MADKDLATRGPDTLVRRDRTKQIKQLVEKIIVGDMRDVALKNHMYKPDEALKALGLTREQILKVREWEKPKKDTAMGMVAAHERATAFIRKQEGEQHIQLNVTNMSIQLPPKVSDETPAVVIDIEAQR